MKEELAKDIIEALAWMSLPLDKLLSHLHDFPEGDERNKYLELIGEILNSYDNVMCEVLSEHRNLDPIGVGEDSFFLLKQKYQTDEYPAIKLTKEQKASATRAGLKAAAEIEKEMNSSEDDNTK